MNVAPLLVLARRASSKEVEAAMKALTLITMALPLIAWGQGVVIDNTGGYSYRSQRVQQYDPSKTFTFSGYVSGISVSPPMPHLDPAVTILVRASNGGTAYVELGPAWYIEQQPVHISIKDQVDVTGVKVMDGNRGTILASRVVDGDQILIVRDKVGYPMWDAMRPTNTSADANKVLIQGNILTINKTNQGNQPVMLTVGTQFGAIVVPAAPVWYLAHQNFTFEVGQNLSFYAGPNVQLTPGLVVLTDRMSVGTNILIFRQSNGMPMWQSWSPAPADQ